MRVLLLSRLEAANTCAYENAFHSWLLAFGIDCNPPNRRYDSSLRIIRFLRVLSRFIPPGQDRTALSNPITPALPLIAIVGRPNVGKSTLFNRLIGQRRAIVGDEPGITRDRIYGEANWRTTRFAIVDTGGIVPDDDATIPANIFKQAGVAIAEASALEGHPDNAAPAAFGGFTVVAGSARCADSRNLAMGRVRRTGGLLSLRVRRSVSDFSRAREWHRGHVGCAGGKASGQ